MNCKKIFLLTILNISTLLCKAQKSDFKLDTLLDKYLVRIKVYEKEMNEHNIKANFTFYDSAQNSKLRFVYYFKFLPPKEENEPIRYVPIFQDWDNVENSRYLWNDITNGEFDYEKIKKYVFEKFKNKDSHSLNSLSEDTMNFKKSAKSQFLKAFNSLIKKDYLTFAKSFHPAELKKISYTLKAEYLKNVYKSTDFHFISSKVDSISKLINFFGEIQILLFITNKYKVKSKKADLKQYIVARSFDNGINWYFKEIIRSNYASYSDMSKGNLEESAISWDLIKSIKF